MLPSRATVRKHPGSPAALGAPSLIALGVWILLGAVFYLYKRKQYMQIPKPTMDYLIFGEKPETDVTHEPASKVDLSGSR